MSVLIFGEPNDIHTSSVKWGLNTIEIDVGVFSYADFLTDLFVHIDGIPSTSSSPVVSLGGCNRSLLEYDTVWNRRAPKVNMPVGLDADDHNIASKISRKFLDDMRLLSKPSAQVWVNDRICQKKIDSKLNQLVAAQYVGFNVPKTIFSNNPTEIRAFAQNERDDLITKTIAPMLWNDENTSHWTMTESVDLSMLQDDLSLSACPMIYQSRVEKSYELRIIVCGAEIVCVKLGSQEMEATKLDWRTVNPRELSVELYELPEVMKEKILKFMRIAGLVHGSFDFAVSPEGEYIFFEINEQGQTLWVEDANPEIPVLDIMVEFLSNPSIDFKYESKNALRLADCPEYVA